MKELPSLLTLFWQNLLPVHKREKTLPLFFSFVQKTATYENLTKATTATQQQQQQARQPTIQQQARQHTIQQQQRQQQ